MSELTFEQMLEESLKTIHAGEVVEGTVIDVKPEEIILNIGYNLTVFLPRTNTPTTPAWILPRLPRLVTPWKSRS